MSTYFNKFHFDNINHINDFFRSNSTKTFDYKEIQEVLCTENISFVLSGINRLQSTLLCEEGFSYVQQSQRYVPVDVKFIKELDNTPSELRQEGRYLIEKSINLYNQMTVLKEPNLKGRPSIDDFVFGISYEDARSVLPLAISTNIVVTMSGDRLVDLVSLFFKYQYVFKDIYDEFKTLIPAELMHKLVTAALCNIRKDVNYSDAYFKCKFDKVSLENPVVLLNGFDNVALAALASQNVQSPDIIYDSWGSETKTKSNKLIKNVLGYNHTGINEHSRNTCVMTCSLAAYHQVIRHRLHNIKREPLRNIIFDDKREYVIPKSIKNHSIFNEKVNDLIKDYINFYNTYSKKYDNEFIMQYMLNCAAIKFIVSSNIRNDNIIFRDRLCYTAQEEIRTLYLKKFKILYNLYPNLVTYGLPPCVTTHKCKEGKLSCGRMADVIDEYGYFI